MRKRKVISDNSRKSIKRIFDNIEKQAEIKAKCDILEDNGRVLYPVDYIHSPRSTEVHHGGKTHHILS